MRKKLNKGFNINLVGEAQKVLVEDVSADVYAFKPTDFQGLDRPKILVNAGDNVKAGTPIFFDKRNDKVKFTAPVSGEVIEVLRGEKRRPLAIKILADKTQEYVEFPKYTTQQVEELDKTIVTEALLNSGVWANLVERPFGLVPNPENTPRDIFISAFDTGPLAVDYDFVFEGEQKYLQAGVNVLAKLTSGKVHVTTKIGTPITSVFKYLTNVEQHEFGGPHPAGNVGVQIHHIAPISKGERVWTISPYGLQQIGRLFLDGRYDSSKIFALTGSEVSNPQYYKSYTGASIKNFVAGNTKQDHVRYVSGNILTGEKIDLDNFLGFHHNALTVIPEGDYHEFFGWILPTTKKLSFHRAWGLLSFLNPKKKFKLDTNLHGEERAFVQSGSFEQVTPMSIYPVFLLKAILARDYEGMEALGIYEVLEEDFALCEFIDVSKMDIQEILREGMTALQEA